MSIGFQLDETRARPLYLQICDRFKEAIGQRLLRPGDRVPAVRALALELGLARGTIEAAYGVLSDEGYLVARGAAGTVVSSSLPVRPPPPAPAPGRLGLGGNPEPSVRPLQMGLPALDAFPRKTWTRLVGTCLRRNGTAALAYPEPSGERALRERIAAHIGISRGVECDAGQVFVTAGYRASLELILRSAGRPGDAAWFEDPGYFLAARFLRQAHLELVPVPVDRDGLVLERALAQRPDARFAILTPANQSPLGVSLAVERRIALLDWAGRQGSWIIEDDYDGEFRYHGRPLPALKSLDRNDRVIYCGSFSKVMFPGLRLAYVVVPRALAGRFAGVAGALHAGPPAIYQTALAEFIGEGHFARHLNKMRGLYAQRRAMLAQALDETFGDALAVEPMLCGLHLLARLPRAADDAALAERAREAGFGVRCLSEYYLERRPEPGLMLGFANVPDMAEARGLAVRLRDALGAIGGQARD